MKKRNQFSSFDYLVDNLFTYQDKVEVKVFHVYRNKKVVVKTLSFPKVKGKDEAYYIKEARKEIRQLISSRQLESLTRQYIKSQFARKALTITFAVVGVGAVTSGTIGGYILYDQSRPRHTVTWKNYDGTILRVDEDIKHGDFSNYTGETPTRKSDDLCDYTFSSWSDNPHQPVYRDMTFTAQYKNTKIPYTLTLNLNGGSIETIPTLSGNYDSTFAQVVPDLKNVITPRNGYDFVGWTYVKDDRTTLAKPKDLVFEKSKTSSPQYTIYAYYQLHQYSANFHMDNCKINGKDTHMVQYKMGESISETFYITTDDENYLAPNKLSVVVEDSSLVSYKYTLAPDRKSATFTFTSSMPHSNILVGGSATRIYHVACIYKEEALEVTGNKEFYDVGETVTLNVKSIKNASDTYDYSVPEAVEVTDEKGDIVTDYTYNIIKKVGIDNETEATFTYTFTNQSSNISVKFIPRARNYVVVNTPNVVVGEVRPYYHVGDPLALSFTKYESSGTIYSVPGDISLSPDSVVTPFAYERFNDDESTLVIPAFMDTAGTTIKVNGSGRQRCYVTEFIAPGVIPVTDFETTFFYLGGEIRIYMKLTEGWSFEASDGFNYNSDCECYINGEVARGGSSGWSWGGGTYTLIRSSSSWSNTPGPIKVVVNAAKLYYFNTDQVTNLTCDVDTTLKHKKDDEVEITISATDTHKVPTDSAAYTFGGAAHIVEGTFIATSEQATFKLHIDGVDDNDNHTVPIIVSGIPK